MLMMITALVHLIAVQVNHFLAFEWLIGARSLTGRITCFFTIIIKIFNTFEIQRYPLIQHGESLLPFNKLGISLLMAGADIIEHDCVFGPPRSGDHGRARSNFINYGATIR